MLGIINNSNAIINIQTGLCTRYYWPIGQGGWEPAGASSLWGGATDLCMDMCMYVYIYIYIYIYIEREMYIYLYIIYRERELS